MKFVVKTASLKFQNNSKLWPPRWLKYKLDFCFWLVISVTRILIRLNLSRKQFKNPFRNHDQLDQLEKSKKSNFQNFSEYG